MGVVAVWIGWWFYWQGEQQRTSFLVKLRQGPPTIWPILLIYSEADHNALRYD